MYDVLKTATGVRAKIARRADRIDKTNQETAKASYDRIDEQIRDCLTKIVRCKRRELPI
jgi:hypothetical protein